MTLNSALRFRIPALAGAATAAFLFAALAPGVSNEASAQGFQVTYTPSYYTGYGYSGRYGGGYSQPGYRSGYGGYGLGRSGYSGYGNGPYGFRSSTVYSFSPLAGYGYRSSPAANLYYRGSRFDDGGYYGGDGPRYYSPYGDRY